MKYARVAFMYLKKKYMDGSQKLSLENSSFDEILGSAHKDV